VWGACHLIQHKYEFESLINTTSRGAGGSGGVVSQRSENVQSVTVV
jgi:hypothetical protein